jgi:hypothetical protein
MMSFLKKLNNFFQEFSLCSNKKIPVFMIVFFDCEVIRKTLESLLPLKNYIEIILIENPSEYSADIFICSKEYQNLGLVKKHFLFEKNIMANAMLEILYKEFKLASYEYVVVTDGDLRLLDLGWLEEAKETLKNREVFAIGVSLDMHNLPTKIFPESINWVPHDISISKKYIEADTGMHFLTLTGKTLHLAVEYINNNNLIFTDFNLKKYSKEVLNKKWCRTRNAKAAHLTWDSYSNPEHPYTQFKLTKTFDEHWNQRLKASYKVLI